MSAALRLIFAMLACLLLPFAALAQQASRADCTPICGNPTCCIARTTDVAVCAIDGKQNVRAARAAGLAGKGEDIANMCVGQPKAGHTPLTTTENLARIKRLSCKWGCCPKEQTALFATENTDTLIAKTGDTETKTLLERLKRDPGSVNATRAAVARRAGAGFLCIFCCTF